MKILFVSESIWLKGVVYDLHTLAEGLSLLGHKVYAVDPGESRKTIGFSTRITKDVSRVYPEAHVYLKSINFAKLPTLWPLPFSIIPGFGFLSAAACRFLEIQRVIKDEKIDLIVLYSSFRSGLQTAYLAKKHKIPVVFRNVDILYNLYSTPLMRTFAKFAEKLVYPNMDAVLALTPKYAQYLVSMGADNTKVSLLPFPIDTELFRPSVDCLEVLRRRWNFKEDDQIIVFIGTIYEFSGLGEFIYQFPAVLKQVPKAKLLIVGDGPLRPKLERIIDELNLSRHVIITGEKPFETMPQYINAASICINAFTTTTVTKNIFSAKIIQYLACGKATISTSLPGITTLIPGQSCGVVYVDTPEEMARETVRLLKSPERRHELGQAGLTYVKQSHSYDKIIRQFEVFLQSIANHSKSEINDGRE